MPQAHLRTFDVFFHSLSKNIILQIPILKSGGVVTHEIIMEGVDIEKILKLLREQGTIEWSRTWPMIDGLLAMIIRKPSGSTHYSVPFPTLFEYQESNKICHVHAFPEYSSLTHARDGTAAYEGAWTAWRDLRSEMISLARIHGWKYEEPPPHYNGTKCPFCGAIYKYEVVRDGTLITVICQNCGKEFELDEPREHTIKHLPTEYKGTKCPYCKAVYVYKERHLREDSTVICQNCAEAIQLDPEVRYSYGLYADDESY